MYKNPNRVYFWQQVGKWAMIVLIAFLVIAAVVGISSLFDARPSYHEVNVKYSVGALGFDDKAGGVIVLNTEKDKLVSDYIHATAYYTQHTGDYRCEYEVWYYDADKNYIEYEVFDSNGDPALCTGPEMPFRTNDEGACYVDENGKAMAAEYIRIVLKPLSQERFDDFFLNWFKCTFVYNDVVRVFATQASQVNDIQDRIDKGEIDIVEAYPDKNVTATDPAANAA